MSSELRAAQLGHNGGPSMAPDLITPAAVYGLLHDAVKRAGSQAAYARQVGISPTFLHDAMHGRKDIPLTVLNDLGLIRVTRYRRKEAGTNG